MTKHSRQRALFDAALYGFLALMAALVIAAAAVSSPAPARPSDHQPSPQFILKAPPGTEINV